MGTTGVSPRAGIGHTTTERADIHPSVDERDPLKPREEINWRSIYSAEIEPKRLLPLSFREVRGPNELVHNFNDWNLRLAKITGISPSKNKAISVSESVHVGSKTSRHMPGALKHESYVAFRPEYHYVRTVENNGKSYHDCMSAFGALLEGFEPDVEYDLDEQGIPEDDLEFLIDRLERHWFATSRAAQRWISRRHESKCAEELRCDICWDGETTPHNIIVLCEGCDVAVHQECYGVPLVPEGPWLCRKCYLGSETNKCSLCPWKIGALKQTTDHSKPWCHLLCALTLGDEVHILNPAYREPVDISRIHRERWGLMCQACRQREGAPVQCSVKSCHIALHPKCARAIGCTIDVTAGSLNCWKHSNMDKNDNSSPGKPTTIDLSQPQFQPRALDHRNRSFQSPVAPKLMLENVFKSSACSGMPEKQRLAAIELVARYWSLKRTFRRGAALIRGLQVEPWTSGGLLSNVEVSLQQKRQLLVELKCIETLTALTLQRERRKFSMVLLEADIMQLILDPFKTVLLTLISTMRASDCNGIFHKAVDPQHVPDYLEVIKTPMDLSLMTRKAQGGEYQSFTSFQADAHLIYSNAIIYNKPDTIYYSAACKFHDEIEPLLLKAARMLTRINVTGPESIWRSPIKRLLPTEEADSIEAEKVVKTGSETRRMRAGKFKAQTKSLKIDQGRAFGQLVWAKMKGYPSYPARLVDITEMTAKERKQIPERVLSHALAHNLHIVQFFDSHNAWAALTNSKLLPLTPDFTHDLKAIKFKSGRIGETRVKDLKRAHKEALKYLCDFES